MADLPTTPFAEWLSECCDVSEAAEGARELTGDLYRSFKAWSAARGFDRVMGMKAFGDALRDRQIALAGKNEAGLKYRGPIRLRPDHGNAGRFMASAVGRDDRPVATLSKVWVAGGPLAVRDLHARPISFRPSQPLIWECNAFKITNRPRRAWRDLLAAFLSPFRRRSARS